ncbi:MAG: hypothetical protein FWG90_06000 [Oscillospiraceae bacterium]|nr:hypothetical protein [Oscillospiraceae bacterium]
MYQTMQEIEKQYDGKFVCIINCKEGEYGDTVGGEVVAADKDKETILDVWIKNPKSLYIYAGEFPKGEGGFLL